MTTDSEGSSDLIADIDTLLPRCMIRDRIVIERQLKAGRRGRKPDRQMLQRLKDRAETSVLLLERRRTHRPEVSYPEELPLTARKDEILEAIRAHPVVIVAGETGSGKTTQLPKICLEAGRGLQARIACTQPRRVAALSVSRRIAEELDVTWGKEVGCKIRFTDETAKETCIKMMTDGMLLAETQNDPDLYEYDTIIIDEAHERSLNIDFLLGYLRLLLRRRSDLKIIITSATIDTTTFSKAFDDAPVIEVSGRVYPVDIRYWPLEEMGEGVQDYTYIDAAVDAVDTVLEEPGRGDVLLFMPTEKDIHETRRRLEGRSFRHTDILPLFGRLTAADQYKVFQPQRNRRIVVATNIAETSLTIPNIKYVIDPGLARISRYNARTQTHRLPIEPIAQSSASQRAGRCGRVSGGICIRLYGESDLLGRLEYTPPEIQRANLAEVILRMLALRLGDIYAFPFLDPPGQQAIQGGFQLLAELGAIDGKQKLTNLGREMARLPIAPTVSRMVLQAQKEGALREVLIIASAISIQDPRVRPLDQQQQADQEHRKFMHKGSDFLTLLNIWNTYHDTFEHLQTQNAMRKFCRQHFLSYSRMREWRDIYTQIRRALREIRGFRLSKEEAHFDAIHRSVLTGLMSNIAEKKEGNYYRAARSRDVMLFPGSGLFQRKPEKDTKQKKVTKEDTNEKSTPGWIMAAEMVETNRLYARTVARIQQDWLVELGSHLCRASYKEPGWSSQAGRVLVTETLTLYGLQVGQARVGFHRVDPKEATAIFIREALVNDDIRTRHAFLEHNSQIRQQAEVWLMQHRNAHWFDLDEAVFQFYERRMDEVSSIHDLNRVVKSKRRDEPEFLFMHQKDLMDNQDLSVDPAAFPEYLTIEGEQLLLSYAYRPGQDGDGVTITLPYKLVHFIQPETLDWLVPGLLHEKITVLLRGLPKRIRKQFVPIPETAQRIAAHLEPTHASLQESLSVFVKQRYDIEIDPSDWTIDTLPDHLRMRVQVMGKDGMTVMEGRDFAELVETMKDRSGAKESETWRLEADKWARYDLENWSIGDLPERVEVGDTGALPVYGYPGLQVDDDMVNVHLFRDPDEAVQHTREGLMRLLEIAFQKELAWLRRDLRGIRDLLDLAAHVGGTAKLQDMAYEHLKTALFTREPLHPLTARRFEEDKEEARPLLKKLPAWFMTQIYAVADAFREVRQTGAAYPGLKEDLNRLLPADFLARTPTVQLPHLVRYLKAIRLRAERAKVDKFKDRQKAEQMKPFEEALVSLEQRKGTNTRLIDDYRWLLEEYRVSVFAQDLGTAQPVSAKRLQAKLDVINSIP